MCLSLLVGGVGIGYSSLANKWKCIPFNTEKTMYMVGRINPKNNFNAECMYDPTSNGCYIIQAKLDADKEIDKEALEETCTGFVKEYPNVETEKGVVEMSEYTCGKNSTNMKMWNTTGYDNSEDMCYKISENRNFQNEFKRIFKDGLTAKTNII